MINSYVCWSEYQAFVAPGVKSGLIVLGLCVCPLFDNERGREYLRSYRKNGEFFGEFSIRGYCLLLK